MHKKLYDIRTVNERFYGVYSRNFGPSGGWHLLKCFYTYEEAEQYIRSLGE